MLNSISFYRGDVLIKEENLPDIIKRKESASVYISEYTAIYLDRKKENGETLGKIIDKLVLKQKDFRDEVNAYFEENKI